MGRTILDLFQSKVLGSSGKTAEETYSVRNSKDIPISSRNGLINNTSVPAINLVRRNLGVRKSETLFEQEGVGLRPLSVLSSPFIYGTAILRISTQQSDQVNQMKQATGGSGGDRGVIGGLLERAGDRVRGELSKVGVKFPSQLNPTSYAEQLAIEDKSRIPIILSEIKGNADGNIIGRALSQPQTPNQLVRNVAGEAVGFVKNQARGFLFGERSTTGFVSGGVSGNFLISFNYGSSQQFNPNNTPIVKDESVNRNGSTYSSGFSRSIEADTSVIDISLENFKINRINSGIAKLKDSEDDFAKRYIDFIDENRIDLESKSSPATFNTDGEVVDGTVGLINKIPRIIIPHKEARPDGGKLYSQLKSKNNLTQRGIIHNNKRYVGDELNQSSVFNREVNESVEGLNFIPLKFTLLSNSKTIYFRSIIDGISETFSPSWDSSKFVGNPFSFYTYSGVERSVSFGLKVVATTPTELKRNWERLSFLSSMVYPAGYQGETYITPPFIKFTLGNIYKGKEGFIESLSYTFDDQMGWEIGNDDDMKEYKLPKKIDVSIGIKFLENRNNTNDYKKLYSFTPVS